MTEEIEKQAEEYTKEKYCLYCKELRFCNSNKCSKYDDTVIDFIAGAKWGMEHEWHDLRENPNDLPKEYGKYWCKLSNGLYLECTYDYDLEFWFGKTQRKIIAWCELPTYKE